MISREEAERIIHESVSPTADVEEMPLTRALGCYLAREAVSDIDIPPFNRVTMDGYAVVSSDGPGEYEVCEYIPAGVQSGMKLAPGKVARIMTGAPLPDGADAVVPVEDTGGYVETGSRANILKGASAGANVARQGEDLKAGAVAVKAGSLIGPAQISMLATVGCDPVKVVRRPSIGILATGDELVSPAEKPGPGQIRNSNAYQIFAQALSAGALPAIIGAVADISGDLAAKMALGLGYDFFIVSGGVSAGDKDLVPQALERAGYETLFHKVKIKPGKPVLFGKSAGGRYVFGLPGNPVSTYVMFELFVKQALRRFSGVPDGRAARVKAELSGGFSRKSGQREEYIPVNIAWEGGRYVARLIGYHGSGHMMAYTEANGLFMAPAGVAVLDGGTMGEAIILG